MNVFFVVNFFFLFVISSTFSSSLSGDNNKPSIITLFVSPDGSEEVDCGKTEESACSFSKAFDFSHDENTKQTNMLLLPGLYDVSDIHQSLEIQSYITITSVNGSATFKSKENSNALFKFVKVTHGHTSFDRYLFLDGLIFDEFSDRILLTVSQETGEMDKVNEISFKGVMWKNSLGSSLFDQKIASGFYVDTLSIIGCIFMNNGYSIIDTQDLEIKQSFTIKDCNFESNHGDFLINMIVNKRTSNFDDFSFINNQIINNDKGIVIKLHNPRLCLIKDSSFYRNYISINIENNDKTNGRIMSNEIDYHVTVENCHFEHNEDSYYPSLMMSSEISNTNYIFNSLNFVGNVGPSSSFQLTKNAVKIEMNDISCTNNKGIVMDIVDITNNDIFTFTNGYFKGNKDGPSMSVSHINDMEIKNVTFKENTGAKSGGAMYIDSVTSITIDGIMCDGNTVLETGGALYMTAFTELLITKSVFGYNTATKGGAFLYVQNDMEKVQINIEGSLISHNNINGAKGVLELYFTSDEHDASSVRLYKTNFTYNEGHIMWNDFHNVNFVISKCKFKGNILVNGQTKEALLYFSSEGGSLKFANTIDLIDSYITHNQAKFMGNLMYVYCEKCIFTLSNNIFTSNIVRLTERLLSFSWIKTCGFTNNHWVENLGSFFFNSAKESSCIFKGEIIEEQESETNEYLYNFKSFQTVEIHSSKILKCSVKNGNGYFYFDDINVVLLDNNHLEGFIHELKNKKFFIVSMLGLKYFTVENSHFEDFIGTLFRIDSVVMKVSNTTIINNAAGNSQNCFRMKNTDIIQEHSVTFENGCYIRNCEVNLNTYDHTETLVLTDSNFENSVIFIDSSIANIIVKDFTMAHSTRPDGTSPFILNDFRTFFGDDLIFYNNSALGDVGKGGAMYVYFGNQTEYFTLQGDSLFQNNKARYGGAIYFEFDLTHFEHHYSNNRPSLFGQKKLSVNMSKSIHISHNEASKNGGGMYISMPDNISEELVVEKFKFINEATIVGNTAQKTGGGIYFDSMILSDIESHAPKIDQYLGNCYGNEPDNYIFPPSKFHLGQSKYRCIKKTKGAVEVDCEIYNVDIYDVLNNTITHIDNPRTFYFLLNMGGYYYKCTNILFDKLVKSWTFFFPLTLSSPLIESIHGNVSLYVRTNIDVFNNDVKSKYLLMDVNDVSLYFGNPLPPTPTQNNWGTIMIIICLILIILCCICGCIFIIIFISYGIYIKRITFEANVKYAWSKVKRMFDKSEENEPLVTKSNSINATKEDISDYEKEEINESEEEKKERLKEEEEEKKKKEQELKIIQREKKRRTKEIEFFKNKFFTKPLNNLNSCTCYINSILQLLLNNVDFIEALKSRDILWKSKTALNLIENVYSNEKNIRSFLIHIDTHKIGTYKKIGDASMFFRKLLNAIQIESGNNTCSNIFDFTYNIGEECQECNKKDINEVKNIVFMAKKNSKDGITSIQSYFDSTNNNKNIKWCVACRGMINHINKGIMFTKTPHFLVIKIERSEFNYARTPLKINDFINVQVTTKKKKKKYFLYGILIHFGFKPTSGFRHFTCAFKKKYATLKRGRRSISGNNSGSRWVYCDDDIIEEKTDSIIKKYCLEDLRGGVENSKCVMAVYVKK